MTIKDKLTAEPGFQFVIDSMELMSTSGRQRMLRQPFINDRRLLEAEYSNVSHILALLQEAQQSRPIAVVRHQLMQMHDIQGTINNLANSITIEEIELFEVKIFAHLCLTTRKAASQLDISDILNIPDLQQVFSILDPDNTGIPNFYIYDSYHPALPELRKELRATQTKLEVLPDDDPSRAEQQMLFNQLFEQQNAIQQEVMEQLSERLKPHAGILQKAIEQMAYTDFLFAKATIALEWGLCRPTFSDDGASRLNAMWNPRLKRRTEETKQRYQPIDIETLPGVCLITGANMAGKTVLLKTIGIVQLMAQFGFFVPAKEAAIALVDDVIFCIGDEQNEMNGLSSFASEIIKISDCITRAAKGNYLILIDEPARTTNPVEGKAIVQSLATLLDRCPSQTLVTTHYSQLGLGCRRLRVRGFVENMCSQPLSPENINSFMDYSLLPDQSDDVPHEALRIAAILQCNADLIGTASTFLANVKE
ncbi:MAG: hypothetical protein IJR26_03360 [Bacteroidales bacterium]|nr:hypothetical protein [Bacteroidales bacterium]